MSFKNHRHRPHLSSLQRNQMEIEGNVFLCVPEDDSLFIGSIEDTCTPTSDPDDQYTYSLYGERLSPSSPSSSPMEGEVNNNDVPLNNTSIPTPQEFRVSLTDHFTGLSHNLPQMGLLMMGKHDEKMEMGDSNITFICKDKEEADIKFRVEKIHKGQRADMIIQQSIGSSSLLGTNCRVYEGHICIVFQEILQTGQHWCL